jgi:hypothetical protein
MTGNDRTPLLSLTKDDDGFPIPEADLVDILDAIRLIVSSGKGYGELVITFKKGALEDIRPTPILRPEREKANES